MSQKLPISVVMILYNNEDIIERALRSCYFFADEIIVIHDGPCNDRTLEIVKKYTDKIYVRDHYGAPPRHRPFAYQVAKHDWILRIDADEYVSQELAEKLPELIKANVDIYDIDWPVIKNNRYYYMYQKNVLFKKSKIYHIGVLHEYSKPINKDVVVKKVNYPLVHQPPYDNYSFKIFKTKWLKWARNHARSSDQKPKYPP